MKGPLVVGVVALGAFGPYLFSACRTEQAAVYTAVVVLAVKASWTRIRPSRTGVVVMSLLGLELLLASIGAAEPPQNTTAYQLGSALAGIDNLLLPMAVVTAVWLLLAAGADRTRLIRVVCAVTVWAMAVNAGLALWATGGGGPDLAGFRGQAGVESVASKAEQMGRYTGVFNQPAEAGLMCSIALLAAVYLYRRRPITLAVAVTAVTVGGVLTVSKIFLLIGLPVGLWQLVRASGGRRWRLVAVLVAAILALLAVKYGPAPQWTGGTFLLRLVHGGDQGVVDLYTAGRLGDSSTLAIVTDAVLKGSPIVGYGAGGLQVPYDSAWVEALVIGGFFGTIIFTALLTALAWGWCEARRRDRDPDLTRFAGGLVAVVGGGAVGVPSLTVNRCSTIVWLLLALTLLSAGNAARQRAGTPLTTVFAPTSRTTQAPAPIVAAAPMRKPCRTAAVVPTRTPDPSRQSPETAASGLTET